MPTSRRPRGRCERCRRSAARASARARAVPDRLALVGLTVSATTSRPRTCPSQPANTGVRPAASAASCAPSSSLGTVSDQAGRPAAGPADDRGVAVDDARAPRARCVLANDSTAGRPGRGPPRPRPRWPGRSGARRRAPGRRRGAAARRGLRRPPACTSTRAHRAGRDRAGLVQHDRVDPAGGLQHLADP